MDTAFNLENTTINNNYGEQAPLVTPSQQLFYPMYVSKHAT